MLQQLHFVALSLVLTTRLDLKTHLDVQTEVSKDCDVYFAAAQMLRIGTVITDPVPAVHISVRSDSVRRAKLANTVPFFLRSWWLRDRVGNEGLEFGTGGEATHPLWSLHSDPICDAANIDTFGL